MRTTTLTPAWWTDKHASDWDHVKGALERDWEQTKADFSKDGGQKLNQNVADTVKQSMGSEPVPPLDEKTRPTDPEVAANEAKTAREDLEKKSAKAAEAVSKARDDIAKEHEKLGETLGEVRKDLQAQQAKASDKIEQAQDKAIAGIEKGYAKIEEAGAKRADAIAKWTDAEQEVRYGYSVRSQYPAAYIWNDKLEGKLRREWNALATGVPWKASKAGIRRGWDFAGKSH
jgi:hypothetical protein